MAIVKLTQGKVAVVDDSDLAAISKYKWRYLAPTRGSGTGYAIRQLPRPVRGTQRMHKFLMPDATEEIDHINGDGLDNRRCNLREATHKQNMQNRGMSSRNTTGFKGVYKEGNYWSAMITVAGRLIRLGVYDDPVSAACSYNVAAKTYFGEFARLNRMD